MTRQLMDYFPDIKETAAFYGLKFEPPPAQ